MLSKCQTTYLHCYCLSSRLPALEAGTLLSPDMVGLFNLSDSAEVACVSSGITAKTTGDLEMIGYDAHW